MQKILLSILLILSLTAFSQVNNPNKKKQPYPNNAVDLGLGVGSSYGLIGGKAIIGYKGSGLLLGFGGKEVLNAIAIGGQYAQKHFFINAIYGPYGINESINLNKIEKGVLKGLIISLGGRINLIRSKLVFLELGVGFYSAKGAAVPNNNYYYNQNQKNQYRETGVTFNAGIGFRLFELDN